MLWGRIPVSVCSGKRVVEWGGGHWRPNIHNDVIRTRQRRNNRNEYSSSWIQIFRLVFILPTKGIGTSVTQQLAGHFVDLSITVAVYSRTCNNTQSCNNYGLWHSELCNVISCRRRARPSIISVTRSIRAYERVCPRWKLNENPPWTTLRALRSSYEYRPDSIYTIITVRVFVYDNIIVVHSNNNNCKKKKIVNRNSTTAKKKKRKPGEPPVGAESCAI